LTSQVWKRSPRKHLQALVFKMEAASCNVPAGLPFKNFEFFSAGDVPVARGGPALKLMPVSAEPADQGEGRDGLDVYSPWSKQWGLAYTARHFGGQPSVIWKL
jgi:hypothetical protein